MSPAAEGASRGTPAEARAAIERFLKASRQPELFEPGEDPFPLQKDSFVLELRNSRLTLQVWDQTRNLVRRITGVSEERPGRLELIIERFGKRAGRLLLIDLARPGQAAQQLHGRRLSFREQFRRLLSLQCPDWKIADLSTEANLEYSLSPVYPRALLRKGQSGLAALACPREGCDPAGALSFGLIWLDYLRHREKRLAVEGLALFLPQGSEKTVCLRLRFLNQDAARVRAFVYSPEGWSDLLDPRDYGNLDTRLETCRSGANLDGRLEDWLERLCRAPHVERVTSNDGSASLRVRGLQFARTAGSQLLFGLDKTTPASDSNLAEIERIALELARLRSPESPVRENPLYRQQPERWLESQLRAHIEELDASLLPAPVYGQVPAFAGGDRGVLDLLAVERTGRLVVIEVKASEDLHLPLQALDYWMRVKWHLDRGDFARHGYFPGIELSNEPPRLLLAAPSLDFHPTTEVILRYFSPVIPVERIGVGMDWRKQLKVMFRDSGAPSLG